MTGTGDVRDVLLSPWVFQLPLNQSAANLLQQKELLGRPCWATAAQGGTSPMPEKSGLRQRTSHPEKKRFPFRQFL